MVEKTAPFKNIRRKDQPLKQSPVPMGSTSKMCRGDHNLVEGLLIKTLYIQVLGNGIKASIHGSQGNHAWNQEV